MPACGWYDLIHGILKPLSKNGRTALIPPLGVIPGYRKWSLQDWYPQLLEVSARVTSIDRPPGASLSIPGLWQVLALTPTPTHCPLLALMWSPSLSSSPPHPLSYPVLLLHPPLIPILFPLLRNHPPLGPACSLASNLWIVAWLACTLWLISTYNWVIACLSFWVWVASLGMIFF